MREPGIPSRLPPHGLPIKIFLNICVIMTQKVFQIVSLTKLCKIYYLHVLLLSECLRASKISDFFSILPLVRYNQHRSVLRNASKYFSSDKARRVTVTRGVCTPLHTGLLAHGPSLPQGRFFAPAADYERGGGLVRTGRDPIGVGAQFHFP